MKFLYFLAIIKDILDETKTDFEQIFNKSISDQFFESLKTFYGDYPIDIELWIKKFFVNLTNILYNLTNMQEKNIEKCLETNFDKIEPFGGQLPKQIIKQLIISIDAVKMFTTGLTKSRDLIIDVSSRFINPSLKCKRILTQMTKCSLCLNNTFVSTIFNTISNRISSIKPCYSYCLDVYKNCLVADLDQLDFVWNSHLSKKNINLYFRLACILREIFSHAS